MGNNKVFLLVLVAICMFIKPSHAQYDGISFKDSVYVASQTHYFIPQKISASDTSYVKDFDEFTSVEWRENGLIISPDSILQRGYLIFRHQFAGSGSYDISLEMTDTTGVSYFATRNIVINEQIEVPNVFSPDDDGINDIFIVKSGGADKLNLKIYTRNGELIHEKIGEVVYWDGRLASGNYANPGVYYYVVSSQGPGDTVRKGFFHLFR